MELTEAEIIRATQEFLAKRGMSGLSVPSSDHPGWTDLLLILLAYEEEMRNLHAEKSARDSAW